MIDNERFVCKDDYLNRNFSRKFFFIRATDPGGVYPDPDPIGVYPDPTFEQKTDSDPI